MSSCRAFLCSRQCLLIAVLVAVLAWLFKVYPWQWWIREKYDVPRFSYDGRIEFNIEHLEIPETLTEIQDIVKNAYENGRKIRVIGDGHSWSPIAQTEDILISLHKYSSTEKDIEIDEDKSEVTVKAGTPLRTISTLLESRGYAMKQLGSVASQSIAGAMSTGTHGSGLTIGNIASLVTKLQFVSGTGEVVKLSDDSRVFKAAQVSIGLLGVITEVTLSVKKSFKLEESRTTDTLDNCINNLNDLVESEYKYLKIWVEFYHNLCIIYRTKETNKAIQGNPSEVTSFLTYYSFAVATRISRLLPSLTPHLMWLVGQVGFGKDTLRVDKSYLILNDYFELPEHQEGEVIVEYENSKDALEAVREVVSSNEGNFYVNYITEVH